MRVSDERGNAIIEFIAVGLFAQLLIFGFLVKLGDDFRSQIAAQTIARQAIRTIQLTGSLEASASMANQVASVFGIPISLVKSSISENCAATGNYQIKVQVRNKAYETTGFCLK